ncbi:protein kinase domain-containing protein [Succiniclasticum ruminis]|uniref:non-specific serine/threonine protein kinase n=1 Tax=Succiniclasticum ruminis DSM 9236 TaxID=1123323 RepID=A0A1I2DGP7_9FIRM|nr:PASTA domain-containing protein [Succiniclasticum ruminis]SFE79629.1 Serine/threonine protein kinase [Succiniclasticum ruminis DSM 9236]
MVGEILNGRYEILKSVGFGGMAEVYLAKDVLLDRKIAVKVLRKKFLDNKNQLEQFKREARSAARLIHPSIVTIYDVCDEGDISYILMEYVEGVSLKAFEEQNGRMDPGLAVALTAQLASALDHAHKHNIIHCDIKPQNIVLTEAMVPKIVDFGISRIVSNETMAFTASVVGSVHYFSPEQAQGLAVTAQSDIYSLGIVFYEMLTGKVPFDGNNAVSVARKQVEEQAQPLKAYWPEAPDALQEIIDKALAKNLQDRYATAEDMKNDLMRVKNLIYPSKNNETFLDQTIPLLAIAANSPVKAATAAAAGPSKARSHPEEEKYQTLIMSLPSFLTREVDDDTSEYGQFEEPESTRKVVAVNAEQNVADAGAETSEAAAFGTAEVVAAMGASEAEQQSLFAEDTDTVPVTKKAEPGDRPAVRGEETDGKPVVIPVGDMNGASKPEMPSQGGKPAGSGLSATGTPAVAVAAQKESQGALNTELERNNDKPKKKAGFLKKLLAAIILLFVLLAGGLFYFFSSSKPEIAVADVNGKPVAEAQQVLEAQGFKVEVENKVDTSVKPGTVLRMDPVAGIRRKEGATITLVVSGTEKTTMVPKVVGLKQDQAEKLLSEKNLRIEKIEYKWEQDKPEGIILSQSPEEKSQLGENGAVNIVINKKEEKNVAVPDLKGMTLAEARKKLEDLKLKVEVREEDSEKNKDTVIGMSPEVNDTITEGSTVVLLVSNAKKQAGFPATPDKINSNSGKSNGSVTVNRTTGARYAEFVVPGTGTHTVQIVSNNGRSQKVEVSGSYNGGVRLRTKVDSDVQRVGFYVDHRLVEEKSW